MIQVLVLGRLLFVVPSECSTTVRVLHNLSDVNDLPGHHAAQLQPHVGPASSAAPAVIRHQQVALCEMRMPRVRGTLCKQALPEASQEQICVRHDLQTRIAKHRLHYNAADGLTHS